MTAPKRRWFRFSLRTLFVVVTVFGIWLGWNLHQVRERNAATERLRCDGVEVFWSAYEAKHLDNRLPIIWSVLGDKGLGNANVIRLSTNRSTPEDATKLRKLFPEAYVELARPGVAGSYRQTLSPDRPD